MAVGEQYLPLMRPNTWIRRVLTGALLVWCLLASASSLRTSLARNPDPMGELEAEFRPLAFELPATGEVGYLEQYGGATDDAVRMYYAAQYALVPRVVVGRIGPEFLIVARGMARPEGEPRLDGYFRIAAFPGGHRLFRKLIP